MLMGSADASRANDLRPGELCEEKTLKPVDYVSDNDLPSLVNSDSEHSDLDSEVSEDPEVVDPSGEAPALANNSPFMVLSEDMWLSSVLSTEPEPLPPVSLQLVRAPPYQMDATAVAMAHLLVEDDLNFTSGELVEPSIPPPAFMPVPRPLTWGIYPRVRYFNYQICSPFGTWVQLDRTLGQSYMIGRDLRTDLFTTPTDQATWRLFAASERARTRRIMRQ